MTGGPSPLSSAPLLELQHGRSDREFARLIGVTRRTLLRWRRGATIHATTAERAAVALGHHPGELWSNVTLDSGWRARAACTGPGVDRSLFFAGKSDGDKTTEAKRICRHCPVQAECLDWVLRNVRSGDDYGTWAGTNRNERATMRRAALGKAS